MCFGKGGLFSGGSIGGILGGLAGSLLAPEIGIPAALATGLGSGLGSTAGGLASGKSFGSSLEGGLLSGATAGAGSAVLGSLGVPSVGDLASSVFGTGGSSLGSAAATGAATGAADAAGGTLAGGAPSALTGAADAGLGAAAPTTLPTTGTLASTAGADLGSTALGAGSGSSGVTGALSTGAGSDLTTTSLPPLSQTAGTAAPVAGSSTATVGGGAGGSGSVDFGTGGDFSGGGDASSGSGISGLGGRISDYLGKNWLPLGIGGGGLLASYLMTPTNPAGLSNLKGIASTEQGFGLNALNYLNTGTVPGAAQTALDQTAADAKAAVRSNYARLGLAGSTSETQALNQVDSQVQGQKWQIIKDLVGVGLPELSQAGSLYTTILDTQLKQDQALSDAVSRFAGSLAGAGLKSA